VGTWPDLLTNGRDRDRTGGAVGGSRAAGVVGPPSPVRRSESGESGEWVTEPGCPFLKGSG